MKSMLLIPALILASSMSFATEKTVVCEQDEMIITVETNPYEPENAAGTLSSDRLDHVADLYLNDEVKAAKNYTVYFASGIGSDTLRYFFALPSNLESLKKGTQITVQAINKDDQAATKQNPQGLSRANLNCIVE